MTTIVYPGIKNLPWSSLNELYTWEALKYLKRADEYRANKHEACAIGCEKKALRKFGKSCDLRGVGIDING